MEEPEDPRITALFRYPVKGLSPEPLDEAKLIPDDCIDLDRAWAIENGPGRFDPDNPKHLPKVNFIMLMRDERLAALKTELDPQTETLTIFRDGKQVAKGALNTRIGRQMIEQFLAAYLKGELRGPPRIVQAPGHSFCDVPVKCVSIINMASIRDLERITGRTIDPLRFRANIYIDGIPAWQEFDWIKKEIAIGEANLEVLMRTVRCDATNVDPATGKRDAAIPADLERNFNHRDFGIYAKVLKGGTIEEGSIVQPVR